jgi:PleD family two-component response regulator
MGKILFAEDDSSMRAMVTDLLESAGHSVRAVADGTTALAAIRADPPDLVLLDYRMGKPNGFQVCRQIKSDPRLEHLPVLILTAQAELNERIEGFEAGANDYLPKPFDGRELLARIRALLRLSEQGRGLNPTTGLPGGSSIEREFERRRSANEPFTLCYLDLDYFKPFNDRFGFATANTVIEAVGQSLRRAVAGTDHFAGHIGGDDFILMCDRETAGSLVRHVQTDLRATLARFVPAEVVEKGVYRGRLRNGVMDEVPLTRVTAAVLHLDPTTMPPFARLGEMAAEAKQRSKDDLGADTIEVEVRA